MRELPTMQVVNDGLEKILANGSIIAFYRNGMGTVTAVIFDPPILEDQTGPEEVAERIVRAAIDLLPNVGHCITDGPTVGHALGELADKNVDNYDGPVA